MPQVGRIELFAAVFAADGPDYAAALFVNTEVDIGQGGPIVGVCVAEAIRGRGGAVRYAPGGLVVQASAGLDPGEVFGGGGVTGGVVAGLKAVGVGVDDHGGWPGSGEEIKAIPALILASLL